MKSRLEAIDRDPGKIDFIVNSHLHFDHAGGNELVPNATMVVQKREWQAAQDPETAAKVGFFRADFDHGHKVMQVDGEHDLFGDGSVVCLADLWAYARPSIAEGADRGRRDRDHRRRLLFLPHPA